MAKLFGKRRLSDFTDLAPAHLQRDGTQLTAIQKEAVQAGWKWAIRKGSEHPGIWILCRALHMQSDIKHVMGIEPAVNDKKLAQHSSIIRHGELLGDLLDLVVESVDALDDVMGPVLVAHGATHVTYMAGLQFKNEWWDSLSEAMCSVVLQWKVKNKFETIQAWRLLMSFVMQKFRQGFDMQVEAEDESFAPRQRKSSLCDL